MSTRGRRNTFLVIGRLVCVALLSSMHYQAESAPLGSDTSVPNTDNDLLRIANFFADTSSSTGLSIKLLMEVTGSYLRYDIPVSIQVSNSSDFSSLLAEDSFIINKANDFFISKSYPHLTQKNIYVRASFWDPLHNIKRKDLTDEARKNATETKKANVYN